LVRYPRRSTTGLPEPFESVVPPAELHPAARAVAATTPTAMIALFIKPSSVCYLTY
jgi:hypothetical protein